MSFAYASSLANRLARTEGVTVDAFIPDALAGAKGYTGRPAIRFIRTYLIARGARLTAYWANRYATEAAEVEASFNPPRFTAPAFQVANAA